MIWSDLLRISAITPDNLRPWGFVKDIWGHVTSWNQISASIMLVRMSQGCRRVGSRVARSTLTCRKRISVGASSLIGKLPNKIGSLNVTMLWPVGHVKFSVRLPRPVFTFLSELLTLSESTSSTCSRTCGREGHSKSSISISESTPYSEKTPATWHHFEN